MAREHAVEEGVIEHAEADGGWVTRKMTYAGRHGCRDRDFYGYGHTIKIEFKRLSGAPRVHQERERERLRKVGVTIFVINSVAAGIALLERAKANPRRDDLT
jgi:hypothetical protein